MAKEENFIVAIELGSSKVTAIAGLKDPDGIIRVLAYAQEPSESFIRKGRINNVVKMTTCISNMKKKLEEKLHKSITSAYVGIGGMGMHTVGNTVVRHLGEKVTITPQIVNNVKESNISMPGGDREILEVVPQDYKLGVQVVSDPVGMVADSIEGRFLNIIANSSVTESITSCFHNAGLKVAGKPISILTLADAILTESEKISGCVFVDMGAETTSVAVYMNKLLRHFAVIPLGGANVNRDLSTTLQIEDSEAESLKKAHGSACHTENPEKYEPIALQDGRTKTFEEFTRLVEARMEEIILNIKNQISLSRYDKSQLISGIVVTGGAANMKGTEQAFKEFTGFEKLRIVKNMKLQCRIETKGGQAGFNADGSFNTVLAIVDKGEINCCGGEIGETNPDLFGAAEGKPGNETNNNDPVPGTPPATQQEATQQPTAEQEAVKEEKTAPKKTGWLKQTFDKIKRFAIDTVNDDDDRFTPNQNNTDK